MRLQRYALLSVGALATCRGSPAAVALGSPRATGAPTVHVVGTQLVDSTGQPVRLRGVNRSGTEYACAQGWGIFDGPKRFTPRSRTGCPVERSEEHTSELQSHLNLVSRLLLEKKKKA